jgi:hypothetical protein
MEGEPGKPEWAKSQKGFIHTDLSMEYKTLIVSESFGSHQSAFSPEF